MIKDNERIQHFYDILEGAWLILLYVDEKTFIWHVKDRYDDTVMYPKGPNSFKLNLNEDSSYAYVAKKVGHLFMHQLIKKVSTTDISSGALVCFFIFIFLNFFLDKNSYLIYD